MNAHTQGEGIWDIYELTKLDINMKFASWIGLKTCQTGSN